MPAPTRVERPAVLALAGYVEHAFGVWYPGIEGGLHAIPELLAAQAQQLGATLYLASPLSRSGVRVAGCARVCSRASVSSPPTP